jgi:hypothetical protein
MGRPSFGLRPQPDLDQPADGSGKRRLVCLLLRPGPDLVLKFLSHPDANKRRRAGGRATATDFTIIVY